MHTISVIWDLDDDPTGNVQHIARNGVTKDEVEEVLDGHYHEYFFSREEPYNAITFGETTTGKHLAVLFEVVDPVPPTVRPITAFEAPPPAKSKKGKRRR